MNSLFVAALLFLAPPDPTHEQSSTLNNAANRAGASKDVDEDAQMAKVPGGPATPKKQWKKGDARGKPQKPKAKKYKVPPKAEENHAPPTSQARRPDEKGSFERPAETPPQIELNPKPMGSGAPMVTVDQEPQPQGKNYPDGPQPGAAGGIASGTEGSPGGAAVEGTAGKGAQMQPDKKAGGKEEGGDTPK